MSGPFAATFANTATAPLTAGAKAIDTQPSANDDALREIRITTGPGHAPKQHTTGPHLSLLMQMLSDSDRSVAGTAPAPTADTKAIDTPSLGAGITAASTDAVVSLLMQLEPGARPVTQSGASITDRPDLWVCTGPASTHPLHDAMLAVNAVCASTQRLRELVIPDDSKVMVSLDAEQIYVLEGAQHLITAIVASVRRHHAILAAKAFGDACAVADPMTPEQLANMKDKRDATLAAISAMMTKGP